MKITIKRAQRQTGLSLSGVSNLRGAKIKYYLLTAFFLLFVAGSTLQAQVSIATMTTTKARGETLSLYVRWTGDGTTFHTLFINTAGIDLVLIGCIILIASANPLNPISRHIILANGIGRFLFTLIVCYYAITDGLMGIFVVFGIIDFIITSGFIYSLVKTKDILHK